MGGCHAGNVLSFDLSVDYKSKFMWEKSSSIKLCVLQFLDLYIITVKVFSLRI